MKLKVKPAVKNLVHTRIPSRYGDFVLYYYSNTLDDKEHIALVKGDVNGASGVLVRVHSECLTGDVLGSRRCDCGDQLQLSLNAIGQADCGVFIYMRQEGRGIGLLQKLRAYNLQDQGLDTVEANIHLGHLADERDYRLAALILQDLGIRSVRLMTNNPQKIAELSDLGISIDERIPIEASYNENNKRYLTAKAEKMSHLLSLLDQRPLPGDLAFMQTLLDLLNAHRLGDRKKPFVTLSYAQSLDGSIAMQAAQSCALSCRKSLELTHLLRSRHDALLIGVNTVISDNPQLNVRYVEGEDPQPVILDSQLKFPEDARLLHGASRPPFIFTTDGAPEARRTRLIELGARLYTVRKDREGRIDLHAALELLNELRLRTVMVEGGAQVISKFLQLRLVDYCVITMAPQFIGGIRAVETLCGGRPSTPVAIANCQYHTLDTDLIVFGPVADS